MTDAPETIWAAPPWDDEAWESGAGEWDVSDGWAVDRKVEYTRTDISQAGQAVLQANFVSAHAQVIEGKARIAELEGSLDRAEMNCQYLAQEVEARQARIAELEVALTRAVQIAENYATIYSEGKPDDWEDRADNMMWGMHRDIADLKANEVKK
jgi:hypothetical protein